MKHIKYGKNLKSKKKNKYKKYKKSNKIKKKKINKLRGGNVSYINIDNPLMLDKIKHNFDKITYTFLNLKLIINVLLIQKNVPKYLIFVK